MQKFGIEKLRIYATADNLALWSKRQGFDPVWQWQALTMNMEAILRCV